MRRDPPNPPLVRDALLLLKARPTPEQLADRLRPPVPDGLELYLDAADLAGDDWLARLRENVAAFETPPGFYRVVEGPVSAFDRPYFDLTADTPASRLLVDRLVECGVAFGAQAANVHLVAPRSSAADFDAAAKAATLDAARPLLSYYVDRCQDAGLLPLVENMPPVLRMRHGAYVYSAIGMEVSEFLVLLAEYPALRLTLDLSHAQLYVNATRAAPDQWPSELRDLLAYLGRQGERITVDTLDDYVSALLPWIANVHVSNAAGLLGEGLPYDTGDVQLDPIVARLLRSARFVVTETLEADSNRAVHMREAQAAIRRLRSALAGGES